MAKRTKTLRMIECVYPDARPDAPAAFTAQAWPIDAERGEVVEFDETGAQLTLFGKNGVRKDVYLDYSKMLWWEDYTITVGTDEPPPTPSPAGA